MTGVRSRLRPTVTFLPYLLTILSICVRIPFIRAGHPWGDDFAEYLSQAISICNGTVSECVSDFSDIAAESDVLLGPGAYPWGLPICLAPAYAAFGFSLPAFKIVCLFFWALFAFVFVRTAIDRFGAWRGTAASLVVLIEPSMIRHADMVLSDIPFLAVSFLAVSACSSFFRTPEEHSTVPAVPSGRLWRAGVLGFLFFAALQFRTNGLVLPIVFVAMYLASLIRERLPPSWRLRRWMENTGEFRRPSFREIAALVSAFIICTGAVSGLLTTGGNGHLAALGGISRQSLFEQTAHTIQILPEFIGVEVCRFKGLLGWFVLFLIVVVSLLNLRRYLVSSLFVFGTLAVFCIWPGRGGPRFLFCIVPWVVLWAFDTARWVSERHRFFVFVECLAVVSFLVRFSILLSVDVRQSDKRILYDNAFSEDAERLYDFVSVHIPQESAVAFEKPRVLHLATGRRTLLRRTPERILEGADFVAVCKSIPHSAATGRSLEGRLDDFHCVFEAGSIQLYECVRRMPSGSRHADGSPPQEN